MKKLLIVFTLIALYSCGTQKDLKSEIANAKPIILYQTTSNFVKDYPMKIKASAVIKEESNQHITIKKIINPITGEKIKPAISVWAIKYNDKNYFNLGYSGDLNHWNSFVKFDIEGELCAIFIDENSPNILKTDDTYYGGGLTGVLIGESSKWNKSWKDKNGEKKKILFIDTRNIKERSGARNPGSLGNYLTRRQLRKLIVKYKIKVKAKRTKDISFEKIVEILKTINANSKE